MKQNIKKDILYFFYIITMLMIALIYFAVPERAVFIASQKKWWGELLRLYAQ